VLLARCFLNFFFSEEHVPVASFSSVLWTGFGPYSRGCRSAPAGCRWSLDLGICILGWEKSLRGGGIDPISKPETTPQGVGRGKSDPFPFALRGPSRSLDLLHMTGVTTVFFLQPGGI
jgi:hypothetical protein